MSTNTLSNYYSSYEAMRAAHMDLLRLQRKEGETDPVMQAARAFIRLGRATGVILDDDEQRDSAQSVLNYWVTTLYSAGIEVGETTLSDFDESQAPDLNDVACPYRGLSAFGENDGGVFFGRQKLVASLLEHLAKRRLLVVAGPSGSGKSSVVRAGIIPGLKKGGLPGSEKWRCLPPIVPGSHPLENLALLFCQNEAEIECWASEQTSAMRTEPETLAALIEKEWGQDVVLVVDQFEETFTLCDDEDERDAFVANLQVLFEQPKRQHRLILTLRSDFENKVALLPDFQPLFEANLVRVGPLSAAELRQAIEAPAQAVGLKFETGVIESLVGDVLGEPAALPLLQFSLLQLWEKRERNRVTLAAYRRVGGGREALERTADELYDGFIEQYKIATRLILLRLVRPSLGLEVTSQRVRRSELYIKSVSADSINHTVERLVAARLLRLTPGRKPEDDQVEVAHEALVRNWRKLLDWLDKERERIRQRQHLTATAEKWQEYHRNPDLLLRGVELATVKSYEDLNKLETAFIQASLSAEEADRLKVEEEARRLRRLNRSLALSSLLAIFISLLAFYFGIRATEEGKRAEAESIKAVAESTRAVAEAATAQVAEVKSKKNEATALAAQATSFAQSQALKTANSEAEDKAFKLATAEIKSKQDASMAKSRLLGMLSAQLVEQKSKLDLSMLLGIAAVQASTDVFEARNGLISSLNTEPRLLKFLWGIKEPVSAMENNPQSNLLVVTGRTGELALWDTSVPTNTQILFYRPAPFNSDLGKAITDTIAFSPDGHWLAVLHEGRKPVIAKESEPLSAQLEIWDVSDPANPVSIIQQPLALTSTLGVTNTATITTTINDLAFSPDGSLLASANQLGQVTLWNIAPPNPVRPIITWQAHYGKVNSLAFMTTTQTISSTQATILVTVGCIGTQINAKTLPEGVNPCSQGDVVTWDVSDPQQPKPIGGFLKTSGALYAEEFSYGSDYYFRASSLATGINLLAVRDNYQNITLVDLTDPQSPLVAGNYYADTYNEYDTDQMGSLVFSQNGQQLAATNPSGSINVLSISTDPDQPQVGYAFESLPFLPLFDTPPTQLALDADGKTLFTSNSKSGLQVWNVDRTISWTKQNWQNYLTYYGYSVAFHPTQPIVATNHASDGIRLWDISNPNVPRLISHFAQYSPNAIGRLSFNKTGQYLIYSSYHIELWELGDPSNPQLVSLPSALGETISMDSAAKFSPADENIFAVGNDSGKVQFWQINSPSDIQPVGRTISAFAAFTVPIKTLSFSGDGKLLAIFNVNGEFRLWDVSKLASARAFANRWNVVTDWYQNAVENIALRNDGKVLLVAGCESSCATPTLQIWDISNPSEPELAKQFPVPQHPDGIYSLAYSPDGKMAATSDTTGKVVLWDLSNIFNPKPAGEPLMLQNVWVDQVAFDATGQFLAAISDDTSAVIYQVSQAGAQPYSQLWELPIFNQFDGLVSSSDGSHLFSLHRGNWSGGINTWRISESDVPEPPSISATIYTTSTHIATNPNGTILAAVNTDGQVTIWDTAELATPRFVSSWALPDRAQVTGLAFSPTQNRLATSSADHFLHIWDLTDPQKPKLTFSQEISEFSLGEVVYSSDGNYVIVALCAMNPSGICDDVRMRVYGFNNAPGLALKSEVSLQPGTSILQILPQPNGELFAALNHSGSDYGGDYGSDYALGFVYFWSISADGQLVSLGEPWQGQYTRLAFREDGRLLAFGLQDGSIKLADVNTDLLVHAPRMYALTFYSPTFNNYGSEITGLAFVEDGNILVSTSSFAILAQQIDLDETAYPSMIETACNLVNRNLTSEEWNLYFPAEEYQELCPRPPK